MMQAYAEGWELLEAVDKVDNVAEVFASWRGGTVIRSWLLDLLVAALDEDEHLEKLTGYAEDSGEGRWTVEAAIDNAVPMHVIAASLFARFTSRQDDSPAMKAISAMRNQFGGHAVAHRPAGRRRPPAPATPDRAARVRLAPDPPRLPVLRDRRRRARRRRHGVRRAQRPGQDQPRRGHRLPLPADLAPGRHRRAAGPGRLRAGGDPGGRRQGGPDRRARGRDQPRPGQPRPGQQVGAPPHPRPGRPGAHRGLLARGPRAGQGRPVRAPPLPRRPAGAAHAAARRPARRLRPGAQAAQLAAQDDARRAARRSATTSTPPRPSRSGTSSSPSTAPSCSRRGSRWSTTCGPTSARPTRPWPAGRRARTPSSSTCRPSARRCAEEATWRRSFLATLAERRKDELDRGLTLVGPHRDELLLTLRRPAPTRSRSCR